MSDDLAIRKLNAQAREFPQTMELFDRIRDAMAARLFMTTVDQAAEREGLYLRVATLDAMKGEMQSLMFDAVGNKDIAAYVETLAQPKQ